MNELVKIHTDNADRPTVMGRELHEALKIETPYRIWFPRMCEYGFSEREDYTPYIFVHPQNKQEITDHQITLDMAKEICMIQRSEIGSKIRRYFIEAEKQYRQTALDYSNFSPQLQVLMNIETKQREQEAALKAQQKAIEEQSARIDSIGEVIALDVHSWRKDAQHLISSIATKCGGFDSIKDIYNEIYRLVEQRAGVSLSTRLTNKRRRMAEEGVSKSKRDKLTKVDIIADDKKLIEIYLAIVKEIAVKSGIC